MTPGHSAAAAPVPLTSAQVLSALQAATASPGALVGAALQLCQQDAASLRAALTAGPSVAPAAPSATGVAGSQTTTGAARRTAVGSATAGEALLLRRRALDQIVERFRDGVRPASPGWDSVAVAALVGVLVEDFAFPLPPVLVARGVALGVDHEHERTLRTEFLVGQAHAPGPLAGQWVPSPPRNLRDAFERRFGRFPKMSPHPHHSFSLTHDVDATPTVRLLPPSAVTVRAVTTFADQLDDATRLPELPTPAAVAPLAATDHRTTPLKSSAAGGFGFGPLDDVSAWDATCQALASAAADGAHVAVVPELNLGSSHPATVALPAGAGPYLVLCGSRHVVTPDGFQVNEATLLIDGAPAVTHRKLHPLQDLATPANSEDVSPGSELTITMSQQWTIAVLICADVNWAGTADLLKGLGVNLVLVASMTPKMGFFPSTLEDVSARSQALAVWANDPAGASGVHTSMFVFPSASPADAAKYETDVLPQTRLHDWSIDR